MSYKPSDFFVGVIDFFGVIMPGAIATYLLAPSILRHARAFDMDGLESGPSAWAAFFVGSYVLGHLVFLVGSLIDYGYDPVRRFFKPQDKDQLFLAVSRLEKSLLGGSDIGLNPFKFAKSFLQFHHAGASADIAHLEADSKFFRSLSIVIMGSIALGVTHAEWSLRLVGAALLILCLWRYGERRWQSTQAAYAYLLTYSVTTLGKKGCGAGSDEELK